MRKFDHNKHACFITRETLGDGDLVIRFAVGDVITRPTTRRVTEPITLPELCTYERVPNLIEDYERFGHLYPVCDGGHFVYFKEGAWKSLLAKATPPHANER